MGQQTAIFIMLIGLRRWVCFELSLGVWEPFKCMVVWETAGNPPVAPLWPGPLSITLSPFLLPFHTLSIGTSVPPLHAVSALSPSV